MKHYLKFIEKTNFIFFLLFIFSATFASELFRFFGTIWFVSWILEFRFIKKENLHKDRIIAPFIFLGAWWLFQALSLIWTSNTVAGISTLNKQIYLIGFLVVTLFGVNKEYNLKTIFTTFIAGVVVSSLVYFFSIFYFTNQAQYFTDPFNKHTLLFPWQEYAEYSSFIKHRLYHCTLLITSLIFTGYMYRIWKKQVGLYYTLAIVLALTGIIMATILLTGSSAALLSIFLIPVVYFIRSEERRVG